MIGTNHFGGFRKLAALLAQLSAVRCGHPVFCANAVGAPSRLISSVMVINLPGNHLRL